MSEPNERDREVTIAVYGLVRDPVYRHEQGEAEPGAKRIADYREELTAPLLAEIERLKERAEEAEAERDLHAKKACHHGWRGRAPKDGERIVTPCPACGLQSLFIGDGGHLTCSVVPGRDSRGCLSPSVEETVGALKQRAEKAEAERDEARATLNEAIELLDECITRGMADVDPRSWGEARGIITRCKEFLGARRGESDHE